MTNERNERKKRDNRPLPERAIDYAGTGPRDEVALTMRLMKVEFDRRGDGPMKATRQPRVRKGKQAQPANSNQPQGPVQLKLTGLAQA